MPYYVYVLLCADGTFYTGSTSNLKRRVKQHENGAHRRAYTYSRRPVKLVWSKQFETQEEAEEGEKAVKRWSRARKEALLDLPNRQED